MIKVKGIDESDFKLGLYTILTGVAGAIMWFAIHFYAEAVGTGEVEIVATIGAGFFLISVFLGRYLTEFWLNRGGRISYEILIALGVTIVVCIAWIFYHGDRPFVNRPALNLLMYWLPFLLASTLLGIFVKMARHIGQDELKEAQTLAAHSQSELHLLQSQLSPHFLFNTLNNLYGLSITQHEKIPPLLLKLSELLRYSVYDSAETFVPLKDELAYIDNYIEFEKIRIGDRLVLNTDIEKVSDASIKIAPMLLIVFIENAFKHSKNTADEKIFINLSLKIWGNSILFYAKNSHQKKEEEVSVINKSSGFGLVNVNKRLQLLYPKQHELEIENEETSYIVNLKLKIK
ncbi:sensor histidine kinase [Dyadobacter sp. CY312]|uniref:sensor histidine kinase n=1 Tax=Dyadobacter sp. CY312 TaxID=2907303 RepID=UPI001F395682|nr:histidine kinase [Dyadobacter sp. CY312]MCE7042016.1 histidine kinase [Dyadobacter sp. CY312]